MSRDDEAQFARHLFIGGKLSPDGTPLPIATHVQLSAGPVSMSTEAMPDGQARVTFPHLEADIALSDGSMLHVGDTRNELTLVRTPEGWRVSRWRGDAPRAGRSRCCDGSAGASGGRGRQRHSDRGRPSVAGVRGDHASRARAAHGSPARSTRLRPGAACRRRLARHLRRHGPSRHASGPVGPPARTSCHCDGRPRSRRGHLLGARHSGRRCRHRAHRLGALSSPTKRRIPRRDGCSPGESVSPLATPLKGRQNGGRTNRGLRDRS